VTKSQRIQLMSTWWPDACAAAGWNPADRERRLEVLSDAVQRSLKSANDLNHTTDIDKVKSHLLAISQPDNLRDQVAIANMEKTRLLHAIRSFSFHHNYVATISANKFGVPEIESLTVPQLIQLRNTMAARSSAKRRKGNAVVTENEPF
jgi:hypothetical protein